MSWNIQKPGDYINGPLTVIGTMIRGAVAADTTTTDAATMVNIGNFAVQFAPSNGTLFAIKPGAANGSVDLRIDARSGNYPDLRFLLGNAERVRFDYLGNIGVSVTPSAWSAYRAIGINNQGFNLYSNILASIGGIVSNGYYNGTNWIYLNSASSARYEISGNSHAFYAAPSGTATNPISGANAFVNVFNINAGGAAALAGGNVSANGVGLTFPSTQSASTDANTLDDYEEGTFTPTVVGNTTAGTATYSAQTGKYTKVGRLVTFNLRVTYTGGTGAGFLRIAGLPFATGDVANYSVYAENISLTAGNYPVVASASGVTSIGIDQLPTGGGAANSVAYDAAGDIWISGSYIV